MLRTCTDGHDGLSFSTEEWAQAVARGKCPYCLQSEKVDALLDQIASLKRDRAVAEAR